MRALIFFGRSEQLTAKNDMTFTERVHLQRAAGAEERGGEEGPALPPPRPPHSAKTPNVENSAQLV